MKNLVIMTSVFFISCASHHQLSHEDSLEYASYQMNCPKEKLKLISKLQDRLKIQGCNETAEFEKMCSLGPCYLVKK